MLGFHFVVPFRVIIAFDWGCPFSLDGLLAIEVLRQCLEAGPRSCCGNEGLEEFEVRSCGFGRRMLPC